MKKQLHNVLTLGCIVIMAIGCNSPQQVACPQFKKSNSIVRSLPKKNNAYHTKAKKFNSGFSFKRNNKSALVKADNRKGTNLQKISPISATGTISTNVNSNPVLTASTSTLGASSSLSYSEIRKDNAPVLDTKKMERKMKRFEKATKRFNKQYSAPTKAKGFATASLIFGIVGLFVAGILFGALAVVFASIALSRYKMNPDQPGKGMAIAGLILGLISIVGALIIIAAMA